MKINKEDFTYTTDYVWCMAVVVLFRTTTEGCVGFGASDRNQQHLMIVAKDCGIGTTSSDPMSPHL